MRGAGFGPGGELVVHANFQLGRNQVTAACGLVRPRTHAPTPLLLLRLLRLLLLLLLLRLLRLLLLLLLLRLLRRLLLLLLLLFLRLPRLPRLLRLHRLLLLLRIRRCQVPFHRPHHALDRRSGKSAGQAEASVALHREPG